MVPAFVVGVPRCQFHCPVTFCTLGAAIYWSSCEHCPTFDWSFTGWVAMWSHPGLLIFVTDAGHTSGWSFPVFSVHLELVSLLTGLDQISILLNTVDSDSASTLFKDTFQTKSKHIFLYTPTGFQSMRFSVCLVMPSCGFNRGLFRNGSSVLLQLGAKKHGFSPGSAASIDNFCLPSLFYFCSKSNLMKAQSRLSEPLSWLICLLLHFLPLAWENSPNPQF